MTQISSSDVWWVTNTIKNIFDKITKPNAEDIGSAISGGSDVSSVKLPSNKEIQKIWEKQENPYWITKISSLWEDSQLPLEEISRTITSIDKVNLEGIDASYWFPLNDLVDSNVLNGKDIMIKTEQSNYALNFDCMTVDNSRLIRAYKVKRN